MSRPKLPAKICVLAAVLLAAGGASATDLPTATYEIEIRYEWSEETHPIDFPNAPHFSRLIAVTHNSRFSLFADGQTASSGLALVATNGRVNVLEAELAEARRRGRVDQTLVAPGKRADAGPVTFEVMVSTDHSLLSFATMLAPSPDWFTGASALELLDDAGWVSTISAPLWVWDAGVDAGAAYDARNEPVQPLETVRLAAGPYFLSRDGLARIGWVTATRVSPKGGAGE